MKIHNISFPHPVLGNDDSINGSINLSPAIDEQDDFYKISITLSHENQDLLSLISKGKAEYICETTCSSTLFRNLNKCNDGKLNFSIRRDEVKGLVEFTCTLVAKEKIQNYSNSEAISDYSGFSFNLDKGEVLAVFGKFTFNADIKYEQLKAVSQILTVVPTKEWDVVNINLDEPKITIELPEKDYLIFAGKYAGDRKYISVFHSSLVLNCLLVALFNITEYSDKFWAQAIMYRLDNEEEFKNLKLEKETVPQIAQQILGKPFSRLIEGIENLENIFEN